MPNFIGPDRGTIEHTKNTISSFSGKTRVRPAYLNYIDIVGTQSRLGDQSGQLNEWKEMEKVISQGSVLNLWCTLCAHRWDRMPNEYLRKGGNKLQARWPGRSFWDKRISKATPMPPGSQVLDARVAGYVVEAAIPRFISREGTLTDNDWAVEDRIVDDNGSMLTHKSDNGG
jgi:hypothetical protein